MSLSQYTSLNLIGHLALDLATDNSSSGTLNNVPTKDVSFIRFTSNSQVVVTGFDPDYSNNNNKILIVSYTGTNSLTIKHSASGFSNTVNLVQCPSATDVVLTSDSSIILVYDSYSQFWRLISGGTSDHSLLSNLQGGGGGNYYHSNQEINTTSDVQFNTVTINNRSVYGGTTKPNTNSGVVASIGSVYIQSDGTVWTKVDSGNTDWRNLYTGDLTNEPTGFPVDSDGQVDRTSSGISFSNVNRQFSISPTGGNSSYSILIKGREYVKTTNETVTISNTEGLHYIYFDESATLQSTSSFSLDFILKFVPVSIVYWDTTNSRAILFGDERHGCVMDSHTHARIHAESGSVYVTGMSPDNFTIDGDGTSESHLTFSVTQGQLRDEDILHTLTAKTTSNPIPIFYRDGTNWRSLTPSISGGVYARAIGSSGTPTTIAYNYLDTGTGNYSRVSLTNNYFVCYHLFGTNDINNPYVLVMGTSQYITKPSAVTGALTEISTLSGLPFVEMVLVATVLFNHSLGDTNSLKASLVSIDGVNFEDWRFAKTLNPTNSAINTHNNLGGIYGTFPYYHSNQPISTTDSPSFTGLTISSITYPTSDGTNGQALVTNGAGTLSFQTVSGGGGGGDTGSLTYQVTNAPLSTLKVGMPVYWNGTTYAPSNASTNTKIPTAIVKEINVGNYTVQFGGVLTLSNVQWGLITGASGVSGLTTSASTNVYYVSDVNDGQITNVSPIFSIPVLNCIKNDGTNSTVEIKFGTLSSTLTNESYSKERETFTGNGSNLTFTLTLTPYSRNTTMVTIDGVVQQSNAFSISDKDIVFSESPPANSEIEVNYVVQKNLNYANITKHTETTVTSKASFTLPVTPNSESEVMAWVGGSYQDNSNFTLSGNILTFDTNVDSGVKVQFVIFSSVQFTDFPFVKRKSVTISNNSTKTLIDVFGNQASGRYDFHVISNPLIGGTVRLQETDPINVRVETFSTDISSTASTSSKLNIYINGSGNLEFQNLLGSSISLMLERHQ